MNVPLVHLGIDSLMAVELRNHVEAQLSVVIPVAQLLAEPTVSELAKFIERHLTREGEEDDGSLAAAPTGELHSATVSVEHSTTAARAALAQIDHLSDDEVDAMLQKLIR